MKKSLISTVFAATLTMMTTTTQAQYSDQTGFYYEIGGGALTDPALMDWNEFIIDLDAYAGAEYSCGQFDLEESLKRLIRDIKSVPDEFLQYLEVAIIDLLYGLGAIALQKAHPGLYEFLTNSFIRHKEFLQASLANCEKVQELHAEGQLQSLRDYAKLIQWRKGIERGEAVHETEEAVKESNGKEGVPWVNGEYRAGEGQEPISLVEDLVGLGYENVYGTASQATPAESALYKYFPDVIDAIDWAIDVLGERVITFSGVNQFTTGAGLYSKIAASTEELKLVLDEIYDNPSQASEEQLRTLSTPNFEITASILEKSQKLSDEEKEWFKQRLASEAATAQEMERAYIVRELLMGATDDPNIYYSPLIAQVFQELVPEIDDQIETARGRTQIRTEYIGGLLAKTANQVNIRENITSPTPTGIAGRERIDGTSTNVPAGE